MLTGLAFALFYTFLGIPIARLAERWNRVSIISVAIVIWSGFTAACGLASNFVMLLAMRVGVGIGEAGCSPPSHSLISDYFEPKRRASALAVYSFGIPLGAMIGAIAGGWLAKNFGWRIAFMAVGVPGLILALLIKLYVREPARGASDIGAPPTAAPKLSLANELKEIWAVTRILFGSWPVVNMVLGVTIVSIAGYGIGQFAPPYFNRAFGLDYATVGLIFGLIGGFSAGLGTLAGGFVSDWASRTPAGTGSPRPWAARPSPRRSTSSPIAGLDWRIAAAILLVPGIFHYTYLGPTFGVVQNVVETRRRATATAVMFLFLNIIALGGGPIFTGWIIDRFAQFDFSHRGRHGLLTALSGMFGGGGTGANFGAQCPGGIAPTGSTVVQVIHCSRAEAGATRQGILVTIGFYAWGAVHYLSPASAWPPAWPEPTRRAPPANSEPS